MKSLFLFFIQPYRGFSARSLSSAKNEDGKVSAVSVSIVHPSNLHGHPMKHVQVMMMYSEYAYTHVSHSSVGSRSSRSNEVRDARSTNGQLTAFDFFLAILGSNALFHCVQYCNRLPDGQTPSGGRFPVFLVKQKRPEMDVSKYIAYSHDGCAPRSASTNGT